VAAKTDSGAKPREIEENADTDANCPGCGEKLRGQTVYYPEVGAGYCRVCWEA
jgi:hypothetical protein